MGSSLGRSPLGYKPTGEANGNDTMYSIYVLKSKKDGNLYVGCTHDIKKRIEYHNSGKVFSTKNRRPFLLIFKEDYLDKYQAYKKERYYKTAIGKRELKKKISYCGIV